MRSFKRRVGGLAREVQVHLDILRQRSAGPRILFFPSQGLDDGAARLRAYAVSDELRALGWRSVVCPKQLDLAARRRIVRHLKPDVILMQTARHELNRPALFPGIPVIVDLDDADYIDPVSAKPLIQALKDSAGVIAGSQAVARFCRQYSDRVTVVWTGTPPSPAGGPRQQDRKPIVTWAASSPMGSPNEAAFVREILEQLRDRGAQFTFRIYCDDGSDAYRQFVSGVVPDGVAFETLPYLYYPAFLSSLDAAAVGLAPLIDLDGFSGGKSFGKVLAYIDRNVPVVTHPVVDHPLFFDNGRNGMMLETAEQWADAVEAMLADGDLRERIATSARADLLRRLTARTAAGYVNRFARGLI